MHYYSHHIDSYTSSTRHLTPMEDLAYRRMLDVYYRDERPLQGDAAAVARRIGLRDQVEEVRVVLAEFFVSTPEGWRQSRCDDEIAEYQQIAQRNRENGGRGGRPRATDRQPTGNPEGTQMKPTGNPAGSHSVRSGNPPQPQPRSPIPSTLYSTPSLF